MKSLKDTKRLKDIYDKLVKYMNRKTTSKKIYFTGKELAREVLKANPNNLSRCVKYISLAVRELGEYDIVNIKGLGYVYLPKAEKKAKYNDRVIIRNSLDIQLKRKKESIKILNKQINEFDFE